jgi:hypothetical protein
VKYNDGVLSAMSEEKGEELLTLIVGVTDWDLSTRQSNQVMKYVLRRYSAAGKTEKKDRRKKEAQKKERGHVDVPRAQGKSK